MFVVTVRAYKVSTVKAIVHLRVAVPTLRTSHVTSITSPSNGKETQQTVVEKTARQTVEAVVFGQIDLRLALWTAELSLSVAGSCMFLQTLTAKCV